MDITETSFEEIEPSFLQEGDAFDDHELENIRSRPVSARNIRSAPVRPHIISSSLPPPLSTASSGKTAFSDDDRTQPAWLSENGSEISMNDNDDFESNSNDNDFLDDFQEFQNKKDDFDVAIRSHFQKLSLNPQRQNDRHDPRLRLRSSINFTPRTLNQNSVHATNTLRQPKSMMDLKSKHLYHNNASSQDIRSGRLKNSISYGNLRNSSRNPTSVRFKKSMPNLSPERIEEEETADYKDTNREYENDRNRESARQPSEFYLNKYSEDIDNSDDGDFIFDSSMIQPQFVPKVSRGNIPLKLSPSMYNMQQQGDLLTPHLHKRTSNRWNHDQKLENFREQSSSNSSRIPSGIVNPNHIAPTYRMRTIKQQIDHNTPVKEGGMYYNPQTLKWEGNEKILRKFEDADASALNPMLIKKNTEHFDQIDNKKLRSKESKNPEVVGDMMFDEKNLRWVSIHNEPPDPFAGIDDIAPTQDAISKRSPFLRSQSQVNSNLVSRSLSVNPNLRKYHSIGNVRGEEFTSKNDTRRNNKNTTIAHSEQSIFSISSKLLEHSYHEENRWHKKVGAWFIPDNQYADSSRDERDASVNNSSVMNLDGKDYMYEIRKMVMNSTAN